MSNLRPFKYRIKGLSTPVKEREELILFKMTSIDYQGEPKFLIGGYLKNISADHMFFQVASAMDNFETTKKEI